MLFLSTISFSVSVFGLLIGPGLACPEHDHSNDSDHHLEKRAPTPQTGSQSTYIAPPTRPLEWGDINFIHTSDTHGWLLGHTKKSEPEPQYSGTLGEYVSFVEYMRKKADDKHTDLLVLDAGDLHDGTGLVDGVPAGTVPGEDAMKVVAKVGYDVMAIGNHELYVYDVALNMHTVFAQQKAIKGRYLTSNVNITVTKDDGTTENRVLGSRFRKFKTKRGKRITAFGVLFNFTGNAANTTVQPVQQMVKESWFADAIKEKPDLFLLVGHMPVDKDNWPLVFDTIRAVHKDVPIVIFGGQSFSHTHLRNCVQLDERSMSLEPGRYMETVGWMSAKLPKKGGNGKVTFARRYLDQNPVTYAFHTGRRSFRLTSLGSSLDKSIHSIAESYNLTEVYGTAPQDYFISRVPYPNNSSLLTLMVEGVMPTALTPKDGEGTEGRKKMFFANSGALRFDLYKGTFTRDDQFIALPFANKINYIPGVPYSAAKQLLALLNQFGKRYKRRELELELDSGKTDNAGEVKKWRVDEKEAEVIDAIYEKWLEEQWVKFQKREANPEAEADLALVERAPAKKTLGYVTTDKCPGVGDDVSHDPLPYFDRPKFVGSTLPDGTPDEELVDVVYIDFIEPDVITLLGQAWGKSLTDVDRKSWTDVLSNQMFGIYAKLKWN